MLANQGIIASEDQQAIDAGLEEILADIESGIFTLDGDDEDIHMAIEGELTRRIGDAGKRLHTARSRNDQVATDFRLYVQRSTLEIVELLHQLIATFTEVA
jgi:argininosuccinate lyase